MLENLPDHGQVTIAAYSLDSQIVVRLQFNGVVVVYSILVLNLHRIGERYFPLPKQFDGVPLNGRK
jgi:hypothetical protein